MIERQQHAPTTRADDSGTTHDTEKFMPFEQRVTCTIPQACAATGLGRTKLYELIGGGYLDTITIGRRRLVHVTSLLNLLQSKRGVEMPRDAR